MSGTAAGPAGPVPGPDSIQDVLDQLRQGQRFVLVLHVRPDGDSIGSTLALARALRQLGKEVVVVRADAIPDTLTFLAGAGDCRTAAEVEGEFDAAVFIDCAGLDRIGDAVDAVRRCRTIVNVDHHPSNPLFGDVNYIDASAAAAGEIAAEIIQGLGAAPDTDMATALYVAVITDTGSFRYASTRPRTFRLAAWLCEHGVEPDRVATAVWDSQPVGALRLLGLALGSLRVELHGAYASVEVDTAMLAAAGASSEDMEGLVNYPRSLRGVEVAAMLAAERAGEVRVSLRSNGRVDVGRLAQRCGGGGHARAAGCTVRGELPQAREVIRAAVAEALAAK